MSSYLTRLAARAGGRPAGATLAPRLAPSVAAPGQIGSEPEEAAVERGDGRPEPAAGAEIVPGRADAAPPETALVAAPLRETTVAVDAVDAVAASGTAAAEEPAAALNPQTPQPSRPDAVAEPARPRGPRAQPPTREHARPGQPPTEAEAAGPVVELQPRPTPRAVDRATRAGAREQDRPPRIEVRIGRVEVRPPRPAPPPAPAQRAPSAPPRDPFAGLAAARRYVDRAWS